MAKLTTKQRNALPDSAFALPSQRKYPIMDESHRKNAKARASQQANKGNISAATKSKIFKKADIGMHKGHHSGNTMSRHSGEAMESATAEGHPGRGGHGSVVERRHMSDGHGHVGLPTGHDMAEDHHHSMQHNPAANADHTKHHHHVVNSHSHGHKLKHG